MTLLRRIFRQIDRTTARRLTLSVLASCVLVPIELAGVALVLPLLDLFGGKGVEDGSITARLADWTGVQDPEQLTLLLGAAIVVFFIVRAAGTLALRWWTLGRLFEAERDAAVRLLRGYLAEPYARHLDRNSAEVLRTLQTSVDQAFGGYVASSLTIFAEALVAVSVVGLLIVVEPLPTLMLAVYFGLVGPLYMRLVQARAYGVGTRMLELSRDSILVARDALDGVKEIAVLQRQDEFVRRFRTVRTQTAVSRRWMQFLREAPRYIIEVLFLLGVAVLLGVLALTGSADDVVATLGIFIAAGFRLMPPIGRLIGSHAMMRSSAAAVEDAIGELERLDELTALAPLDQPVSRPLSFDGPLRFEHVTLEHPTADRPSLSDLSVVINPGESVAVVGPSGAGKTTFVDLLLGLHTPTSGRLTVGGVPLQERLPEWRALVGYVPQDVFLVDASLRENIALGVPIDEIDDDAITRASESAQLRDLVEQLEGGVHSQVGERGVRLSGGQRQRIGIARALYGSPEVLILDEATSALDSETEARISETIAALRSQMTIIAIAHRLSTLRDFERVLFLRDGELAGDGTFVSLQQESQEFARLLQHSSLDLSAP